MSAAVESKKVFKLFWAWDDAKQERWLGEMARCGWHLQKPGSLTYTFSKGLPAEMTYRVDFQSASSVPKKDREEYLALFRDSGWEFAGESSSWYFFRKASGVGPEPEIFSDQESRIAKYRRVLAFLGCFLFLLVFIMRSPLLRGPYGGRPVDLVYQTAGVVQLLCAAILLYTAVRLALHIRRLKRAKTTSAASSEKL